MTENTAYEVNHANEIDEKVVVMKRLHLSKEISELTQPKSRENKFSKTNEM